MSFVNYKKVNNGKTLAPMRIGAGVLGLVLFGSAFFKTKTPEGRILPIFFSAISFFVLIKGILKTRMFKDMYVIDSVLAKSENGTVSTAELALKTGISEKKIIRRMKKYIKKNYFTDCELEEGENSRIILKNMTADDSSAPEEITITCPDCGTEFTARRGAVARCPECAVIINI